MGLPRQPLKCNLTRKLPGVTVCNWVWSTEIITPVVQSGFFGWTKVKTPNVNKSTRLFVPPSTPRRQTYRWCSSWHSSWTPGPCSWGWTPGTWWWTWCSSRACCSSPARWGRVPCCSSPPALSSPDTACRTRNLGPGPRWDRWYPACPRCPGRSQDPFQEETWGEAKKKTNCYFQIKGMGCASSHIYQAEFI